MNEPDSQLKGVDKKIVMEILDRAIRYWPEPDSQLRPLDLLEEIDPGGKRAWEIAQEIFNEREPKYQLNPPPEYQTEGGVQKRREEDQQLDGVVQTKVWSMRFHKWREILNIKNWKKG